MLGKDDTHRRFQSHMSHLGHQSKSEKVDRQTHGQRAGNEWSGLLSRDDETPCKLSVVLQRTEQGGRAITYS